MQVYHNIDHLPVFHKAVVTIGTFDGVHLGHRQIIAQLKREAAAIGGETVLVTFDPHPRKIVSDKPLRLLNTLQEKTALLEAQAIDSLVVVPFTGAFAEMPARAYIADFLVNRFHPHTVIIGYDHRFGKDRSGDFHLLETYAAHHAFQLIEIPVHLVNAAAISSTRIREALQHGQADEASRLLGYDYFFEAQVVEGNRLGRTLGYPTANLQPQTEDKLIPGNGVYAVNIAVKSHQQQTVSWHKGMMNIGTRPTVDGSRRVIEVNIFDFNEDIYGAEVSVSVKQYLRGEQKFNGLEALKQQLAIDKQHALQYL